jgi:hypothetical protein
MDTQKEGRLLPSLFLLASAGICGISPTVISQFTLSERLFVAVVPLVSLTRIVKVEVPEERGVPPMTPVELLRESPDGSRPEERDQVYGVAPPEAVTVWR